MFSVELVVALRFKLIMFGVPVDYPVYIFCVDNAMYKHLYLPQFTITKKNSIPYHRSRENVAAKTILVAKEITNSNLSDLFMQVISPSRSIFILKQFTY